MCKITMSTDGGANCKTSVSCDGEERDYTPQWTSCFVGGRQFFTDDRIGDFSIVNTQKDTDGREGLTHPILQVKYVGDWAEYDVHALATEAFERSKGKGAFESPNKENICAAPTNWKSDQSITYVCAAPKTGKGPEGMDSTAPVNEAGYATGWCGVHVTQHQKPDPSKDSYKFDIRINDSNEDNIGEIKGVEANAGYTLTSKLPHGLVVTAGAIDADPVYFDYNGLIWGSNDQEQSCNFGGFEGGKREGDCGFTC